MTILTLHNDTLLALLHFCTDRSLVNLALTCYRIKELAKPILKQRQYYQRWRTLDMINSASHSPAPGCSHPIRVIAEIRKDPRIAQYVRRIEYSPPFRGDWVEDPGYEQEDVDLLQANNYLHDEVDNFTFLSEPDRRRWKEALRQYHSEPCFLVLLSMCKSTEELHLTNPRGLPIYFDSVINHMKAEYQKAPDKHLKTGMLGQFPAVTRIDLSHWDTEMGLPFPQCWPTLRIPSVQTFGGFMLGDDYEYQNLQWPDDFTDCKIENVIIEETLIRPSGLVELVSKLPHLKQLVHTGRGGFDESNGDEDWDDIQSYTQLVQDDGDELFSARSLTVSVEKWKSNDLVNTLGYIYDVVMIKKIEEKS